MAFALALACAILAAEGVVEQQALAGTALLGELALDGRLRAFRGVLPCLLAARSAGLRRVVGLCVKCGYDLTGNTSGVCPECGEKVE